MTRSQIRLAGPTGSGAWDGAQDAASLTEA